MGRFIVRRLIIAAATIVVLSVIVFGVLRVVPGSPCTAGSIDAEHCRALEAEQALDKPYFPLSVDLSDTDGVWLLALAGVPLAFGAGTAYGRRRVAR